MVQNTMPSASRLAAFADHLRASGANSGLSKPVVGQALDSHRPGVSALTQPSADALVRQLSSAHDAGAASGEHDIAFLLPGPMRDDVGEGKRWPDKHALLAELLHAGQMGTNHILWSQLAARYGQDGTLSNICLPMVMMPRSELTGEREQLQLIHIVNVSHPDDCMRLARSHVGKVPNFTGFLFGSVLSTGDVDNWRHQRSSIVPAFLPTSSLAKVMPLSVSRAGKCAEKLMLEGQSGAAVVNMNDFFLHETMAQLQLAMLGETEEFMEETNVELRRRMGGERQDNSLTPFLARILDNAASDKHAAPMQGESRPIHGPLASRLTSTSDSRGQPGSDVSAFTNLGNALIVQFAGHDTTGHTLSFIAFELARRPDIQSRLQDEVDACWARLGGRELEYSDFKTLPFMTRVITETLRLWCAVPQGTFRRLQFDDYITVGSKRVSVPKGTQVQIQNWSRHRSTELWGADANDFNPDRDFQDRELWHDQGFAAYNPHTDRFSPFTHPPRDCIGKNFAQMEMRVILLHLMKTFSFRPAPQLQKWLAEKGSLASTEMGINLGTMGPRDVSRPETVAYFQGAAKPPFGLPLFAEPRL